MKQFNRNFSRRAFVKGSMAASMIGAGASVMAKDHNPVPQNGDYYDYIIVGAGPGGGPLAANLATAGFKVALVEAGINPLDPQEISDPLTPFLYQTPLLFTAAAESHEISWDFYVKHYSNQQQAERDTKYVPGKGVLYPRGSALGGSASHNAMVWMYPHDLDFDRIANITGDDSWRASRMRPYFEKVESCGYCTPLTSEGHGAAGYIPANMLDQTAYEIDPVLEKLTNAGGTLPSSYYHGNETRDVNHPLVAKGDTGAFNAPQHTKNNVRITIVERLIEIKNQYPDNLHLITGALASKVLMESLPGRMPKAIGVEYFEGKNVYKADKDYADDNSYLKKSIYARREVILAGGTFNTPQLLMLSGIGDRKELKKVGIDAIVDLPGVGKNLQDRYEVPVSVELKEDLSLLRSCRPTAPQDPCLDSYFSGAWEMLNKEFHGPYAMNGVFGMRIENSGHSKVAAPDLAIVGLPIGYTGIYPGFSTHWAANRWTWLVLKGHSSNSGGSVTLKSADPRETPEINFHHFWEGNGDWKSDLASLVKGVKFARNYLKDASVSGLIAREVTPGDDLQTDAEIEKYIKDETWGHHASCSAKIGSEKDKMAVLDSKFRVRGVKGLRVVDASAFPFIPGFFPVAAVFMISEKASEEILREAYQQV